MLESWSTLSALAALVPRMRVGTIVLGNTYRHPADRREDGRPGRHHLGRPPHPRPRRGLAGERARRLRHPLLHDARAARAPGGGLPGDAVALDQDAQRLPGEVLPALRRPARSEAGADAASRADDRRRRRARDPAHRGQARGPLERVGRPEGAWPRRAPSSTSTAGPSAATRRPSRAPSTWRCTSRTRRKTSIAWPTPSRRAWAATPTTRATPASRARRTRSGSSSSSSGRPAPAWSSSRACSGPLPDLRRDLDRFIAEIAPAFR